MVNTTHLELRELGYPTVGGHVVLDFLNTNGGKGAVREKERMICFEDAVIWARAASVISKSEAAHIADLAERETADHAYEELIGFREGLHSVLCRVTEGLTMRAGLDWHDVRNLLARATSASELVQEPGVPGMWHITVDNADLRLIAYRLAIETMKLLSGPDRYRIRKCGKCSWFFLDTTKNRSRRWCSMEVCGNRVKAKNFYGRKRAASGLRTTEENSLPKTSRPIAKR